MHKTNKKSIAYDFDGVASEGVYEQNSSIITGRNAENNQEIKDILGEVEIYNYEGDDLTDENKNTLIGIFKSEMINKLKIDKFYEDSPEQIIILKELTNAEIVQVEDGVAVEPMKFIIFTFDGTILPLAKKLQDEGNEVIVGMIDNNKNIFTSEQLEKGAYKKEEHKEDRWKLYEGILDKHKAEKLLKEMKKIKNKEEWFILADSNNCFRFCQEALMMGFKNGYFPTEEDRDFEENRIKAKEFVKEFYPDIEVAEVKEFSKVSEALEFLNNQ